MVHVANDPVQVGPPLTGQLPFTPEDASGNGVFTLTVPEVYPNPLYGNPKFAPYAPQKLYQATEMFKFFVPVDQVMNKSSKDDILNTTFSWTRVSQFVPFMKMGNIKGQMISTAAGVRVQDGINGLPSWMRDDINNRLPEFLDAPPCWLATQTVTSWSYFAENFAAYEAGKQFPVPAPVIPHPTCVH